MFDALFDNGFDRYDLVYELLSRLYSGDLPFDGVDAVFAATHMATILWLIACFAI